MNLLRADRLRLCRHLRRDGIAGDRCNVFRHVALHIYSTDFRETRDVTGNSGRLFESSVCRVFAFSVDADLPRIQRRLLHRTPSVISVAAKIQISGDPAGKSATIT
jgi:hypothetical protein